MGRKPNQICAHCNQPIATPRKRRHVGYDGWLKGHAPLIIAMYKEGKGADTILGVLASKKDGYSTMAATLIGRWPCAERSSIFWLATGLHIMGQLPIAPYASLPVPTPD